MRRGLTADPADAQGACRVKVAVRPRVAGRDLGNGPRSRVNLRRRQAQVGLGGQGGFSIVRAAGQKAHIPQADQLGLIEGASVNAVGQRLGALGMGTEVEAITHIQHVCRFNPQEPGCTLRGNATLDRRTNGAVTALAVVANPGQAYIRRRQEHLGLSGRAIRQRHGPGIQAQALPQTQGHVTVEADQTIAQQRQVIEAAGVDLADREPAMTVDQAARGRFGGAAGGQRHARIGGTDNQFTGLPHASGGRFGVQRRFQGQAQGTTRRTGTTAAGLERTVEVHAGVGCQGDVAATAGDHARAGTVQVQHRLAAGSVKARAFAHHHKQVGGGGDPGGRVDHPANHDSAALADRTVAPAETVHCGERPPGHVQYCVFTDPDRTAMALVFNAIGHVGLHADGAQRDAATPGIQAAIHGQLANAA